MFGTRKPNDRSPPRPFKPTDAQAKAYGERKVAETQRSTSIMVTAIDNLGSIARSLIDGAKSNPIIGVLIALITVDILEQGGIIRTSTKDLMVKLVLIAFGVEVTAEIAGMIFNALPWGHAGGTSNSDLLKPTLQTNVENPPVPKGGGGGEGASGATAALTGAIAKAAPEAAAAA